MDGWMDEARRDKAMNGGESVMVNAVLNSTATPLIAEFGASVLLAATSALDSGLRQHRR